jgi:hypothetical protein
MNSTSLTFGQYFNSHEEMKQLEKILLITESKFLDFFEESGTTIRDYIGVRNTGGLRVSVKINLPVDIIKELKKLKIIFV